MENRYVVLDQREESSTSSCWNVYLCFGAGDRKAHRLFNGRYEAIAEREEYYNEETEDFDLPEEIKGIKVVGVEDDWVIGGEPRWSDENDTIEFDDSKELAVESWLKKNGWKTEIASAEILKAIIKKR